jgi:hypothetical protein
MVVISIHYAVVPAEQDGRLRSMRETEVWSYDQALLEILVAW